MKKTLITITMVIALVMASAAMLIVSAGCASKEPVPEIYYGLKIPKQTSSSSSSRGGWGTDILSGENDEYLIFGMEWTNNTGTDTDAYEACKNRYTLTVYDGDSVVLKGPLAWESDTVKGGATTQAIAGSSSSNLIANGITTSLENVADDTILEIVIKRDDNAEVFHETVKKSEIPQYYDASNLFQ